MKALLSRVNIYTLMVLSRVDERWHQASLDPCVWRDRKIPWLHLERCWRLPVPLVSEGTEGIDELANATIEQLALLVLYIMIPLHSFGYLKALFGGLCRHSFGGEGKDRGGNLTCLVDEPRISNETFLQVWSAVQGARDVRGALLWIKRLKGRTP